MHDGYVRSRNRKDMNRGSRRFQERYHSRDWRCVPEVTRQTEFRTLRDSHWKRSRQIAADPKQRVLPNINCRKEPTRRLRHICRPKSCDFGHILSRRRVEHCEAQNSGTRHIDYLSSVEPDVRGSNVDKAHATSSRPKSYFKIGEEVEIKDSTRGNGNNWIIGEITDIILSPTYVVWLPKYGKRKYFVNPADSGFNQDARLRECQHPIQNLMVNPIRKGAKRHMEVLGRKTFPADNHSLAQNSRDEAGRALSDRATSSCAPRNYSWQQMINDFQNFISQKNSPFTSWQQFLTDFQNFICRVNKFNSSESTSTGARNPVLRHVPEQRLYTSQNDKAKYVNEVENTDCSDAVNGKFYRNEEVLFKLRETINGGKPQDDEEKELQELGVAQLQESLRKLADELSTLKAENTTLQRKLHAECAEGSMLQSDNDTLNRNFIDNRAENLVLKKENIALTMKLEKKSADLKTIEKQLRTNTANLAECKSLRDKIEKESRLNINKYEKIIDDLKKRLIIEKTDPLTQEELIAKTKEKISNTRISDLRNDKKELEKRLETLTDQLNKSEKDNVKLKLQISQSKKWLKLRTDHLEDRQIELDKVTKKLKKYQQSDLMLRDQIFENNKELERVQNQIKIRDKKIETLTKQWKEYVDHLIEPEHKLARATVDLADSESFRGKSEKEKEIPLNAQMRDQIFDHSKELENQLKVRDQKIEILTRQWKEYVDRLIEPEYNLARVTVDLADSESLKGKSEKEKEIPLNSQISDRKNKLLYKLDNSQKDIRPSKSQIPHSIKEFKLKIDDGESKYDKELEKVKYELKERNQTIRSFSKEHTDIEHVLSNLENQTDVENQQWKQRVFSMVSSSSLKDLNCEVKPDVSVNKIASKGRKKTLYTIDEKEESQTDFDEKVGDDIENSTKLEQVRSKGFSILNAPVEKPPTTINLDYGIFDMSKDISLKGNS